MCYELFSGELNQTKKKLGFLIAIIVPTENALAKNWFHSLSFSLMNEVAIQILINGKALCYLNRVCICLVKAKTS